MNASVLKELALRWAAMPTHWRLEQRAKRTQLARDMLLGQSIATLTEEQIRTLFAETDAFAGWSNADWVFERRLREVGLDGLKVALSELITRGHVGLTREDLSALWARRGLGLLLSTELLCYCFCSKYWVYDGARTLHALRVVGEEVKTKLPRGARSDPDVYLALAPRMMQVRDALVDALADKNAPVGLVVDFVTVRFFLSWVAETHAVQERPAAKDASTHAERSYTVGSVTALTAHEPEGEQLPLVSAASPAQVGQYLQRAMTERGLYYAPFALANFYTALQVKGFLILSGISGTGKTRLAQSFAELLPQPHVSKRNGAIPQDAVVLTVQQYMLSTGRLLIPRQAARLFDPPVADEARDVIAIFDGRTESCPFVRASYAGRDYLSLSLKNEVKRWLTANVQAGDSLVLEPILAHDDSIDAFRITLANDWTASSDDAPRNWLFIPVRPDWRDGRALLGYFNPITRSYEWTPFLRFLLRAAKGYRANDGIARFVILDEMNLAHVEHYLADLLSVLESGRDEDGWTREALQFLQPEDAEGDLPPRELKLPPSLYFIGTVNSDETTHTFSPKVLDRAFVLDFGDADLGGYPPMIPEPVASTPADQLALLRSFSANGRFARIEKRAIYQFVQDRPRLRARLATLHALLRPFELHFGYRVYDEMVAFVAAAMQNQWTVPRNEEDALNTALDGAVCMKVLPRFHGAKRQLDSPLKALLAYCANPDEPDENAIRRALRDDTEDPAQRLADQRFALSHTAAAAIRLMRRLYADGFAAFGG
jgi:hypothetical protein